MALSLKWIFLLAIASLLAACGGGGSGSPVQGASPGGIWRGTDPGGLAVVALIDENGHCDFIRADDAQFPGQVSTSGNTLSAAGDAYASSGTKFPDGSTHGKWVMHGTIAERQSISVDVELTTDAGTFTGGVIDLTFDALYNMPSSPAAGVYIDSSSYLTYDVTPDGAFGFSDLICEGGGTLTLIDPTHNLYRAQLTTTCDNGSKGQVTGLAMLDTTVLPGQILIGFTGGGALVLRLVQQ